MDIQAALIKRCQNNDKTAFDSLFSKYEGYLYTICYGYTLNKEEALDIMQEVLIKVYRHIHTYDNRRPLLPWLRKIAVTTAMNYRRDNRRHSRNLSLDGVTGYSEQGTLLASLAATEDTEQQAVYHDTQHTVLKALQQLPDHYLLPLSLRYKENMTYEEIAAALNLPVGTVKNSIYRARSLLKKSLQDAGILEV